MNLQEINNWLANPSRDYNTGLKIYDQYKANNKFDDYFRSIEDPGINDMHFKLLVQKVRDIHRKINSRPTVIKPETIEIKALDTKKLKDKSGKHSSPNAANRPRIVENPLINAKDLPEELQNLYFENKELTKNLSVKHAEMADLDPDEKNNEKRRQLAEEICQMDDIRTANWGQIDAWWKENKLKGEDQKQNFDAKKEILQISRRIETVKINISREEKRLKNNPDLKEKLQPKIKKWKAELKELEKKLE